ncbi:MAG: S41 family peptidase [Bacteroidetes bacterium]|nr:S41 family peptidase [Bacteroidota bacterium]
MKKINHLFINNLIIILLLLTLSQTSHSQTFNDGIYKFSRVMGLVKTFYVDTVNQQKLVDDAIVQILKNLDPHSIYISAKEVKEMNEPLQGSFDGIGVQFNIFNDTLLVVSPISGGPSKKVGIIAGDRILSVDGENIAGVGIKNSQVFKLLRGKKGSKVTLGIKRKGVKKILDFIITRNKIPIFSLDASYMVSDDIGYIKLSRFAATSMDEYKKAFKKLKEKNVKKIILDLTNNGGGYMRTAIKLADEFLDDNKMVVYTNGINNPKEEYKSTKKGDFEEGKLVVMVDEGSASASEILSGAIQDWDRGVVVGRRSFGKGLVQRQYPLPDGSMIRLTIAHYYTPTGRCIQKSYKNGLKEYRMDLINRYNNGELTNQDSIHFPDSLKYQTLIKQRNVYGGGGIMPDIFVSIDTTKITDYYTDLWRKGILNKFVYKYVDDNRKKLSKQYTDFTVFKNEYEFDENKLNKFIKFAKKEGVDENEEELNISKDIIKVQLKALIASSLWGTSEYYEMINQINPIFKKAVEVLDNPSLYKNKLTTIKN